MATFIQDDFNRANSTTVPGTPAVGGPYTMQNSAVAGISSNAFYLSTANATGAGTHVTFPGAINADMTLTDVQLSTSQGGLIMRWVDNANFWSFSGSSGGVYLLLRWVAGVASLQQSTIQSAVPNDVLRFVGRGNMLYGYVNGMLVLTAFDQYYSSATTTCGIIARSTGFRFDDLLGVDATALPTPLTSEVRTDLPTSTVTVPTASYVYKGRNTKVLDDGSIP